MSQKNLNHQSIPAALDVCMWSDIQFQIALKHKFSGLMMAWVSFMLMNMKTRTGKIHAYRPIEIAQYLGCDTVTVYQMLKKLNETPLADLKLKNMKVTGKISFLAVYRLEEEDLFESEALKTAMIQRDGIRTLIQSKANASDWKLAIVMALNCHLRTGEIKRERPLTWGKWIGGVHETTVQRSIKFLNKIDFCHIQTDYVTDGKIPFTSLARGFFELKERQKLMEGQGLGDKAKAWVGKAKRLLYEAYGIPLEVLTSSAAVKKFYTGLDPEHRFTPNPKLASQTRPIGAMLQPSG